jgi:type II secretory pathway pseudopilin PulG
VDETEKGKAASEKAPKRRRAAWWVEILIAIAVVLVIVGIAIPSYNIGKANARRTEAKMNLHDIQLALERYAAGTGGMYPEFLLGGIAPHDEDSKNLPAQASDPLIREGYLTEYPRNPFAVPQTVKAMQDKYNDPFRPGTEQSKFGYRFGEDYKRMGQVLADFRYPKLPGQKMTQTNGIYYYADTEYPFWDIWPNSLRPKPFLPGEFFYKSFGGIVMTNEKHVDPDKPVLPSIVEYYILGLYGGPHDRGINALVAEPEITFRLPIPGTTRFDEFQVHTWARSTMRPDENGDYLGSARGFDWNGAIEWDFYADPNAVRDAIIIGLTPGDYQQEIWDERHSADHR